MFLPFLSKANLRREKTTGLVLGRVNEWRLGLEAITNFPHTTHLNFWGSGLFLLPFLAQDILVFHPDLLISPWACSKWPGMHTEEPRNEWLMFQASKAYPEHQARFSSCFVWQPVWYASLTEDHTPSITDFPSFDSLTSLIYSFVDSSLLQYLLNSF